MPCGGEIYQRPPILDDDFGKPTGLCEETAAGSQVFTRDWTKSTITVDCKAYSSSIKFKSSPDFDGAGVDLKSDDSIGSESISLAAETALEQTSPRPSTFKSAGDDSRCPGELLGNGICLPVMWPPPDAHHSHSPGLPPYLTAPPKLINIDTGRQLFVDTFLIDEHRSTDTTITHHQPVYRNNDVNPVLSPDKEWENIDDPHGLHFASAYSGGVAWDPIASLYKIWYTCGPDKRRFIPSDAVCLATSKDGVSFDKPAVSGAAVPGTNVVINASIGRTTVFLDLSERKGSPKRFKMSAVLENNTKVQPDGSYYGCFSFLESSDGVTWRTTPGGQCSGPTGDSSTVFLNPFRTPAQWVYSIKSYPPADASGPYGRARSYWESEELGIGADWTSAIARGPGPVGWEGPRPAHSWTNADVWDPTWKCGTAEPPGKPGGQNYTQLYNLDAVAYESVLVGFFSILSGKYCPEGGGVNRTGEWDNVFIGYSRDGYHWSRPKTNGRHTAFLAEADGIRSFNHAMVQSVGGGFTVHPSLLRFYVSGRSGVDQLGGFPSVNASGNTSTGIAEFRRDGKRQPAFMPCSRSVCCSLTFAAYLRLPLIGFASVSAGGDGGDAVLITRPLVFTRQTPSLALFLNAEGTNALRVSVLDAATANPLPGLTEADYMGTQDAGTSAHSGMRLNVVWRGGGAPLQKLVGRPFRLSFRFTSSQSRIYAFWVAGLHCGASWGFLAAGGAGFNSTRDLHCKTDDTENTALPKTQRFHSAKACWDAVLFTNASAYPECHPAGRRALKTDDRPPKLSFEQLGLEFDPASGGITSIRNTAAGAPWFVHEEPASGVPLWQLEFGGSRYGGGGLIDSSHCGVPSFENQSKVIRWHGCTYETTKLDVVVTWAAAELPPEAMRLSRVIPKAPFGAAGRIRVTTSAHHQAKDAVAPTLSRVVFPILRLRPGLPSPAANTTLVWSRESGRSWRDPWAASAPLGFGVGTEVGTPGPTQVGCIVDDDEHGLYWATHDSQVYEKDFAYVNNKTDSGKSNGVVQFSIGHSYPIPLDGTSTVDFSPAYPVILTTFNGGWWDASQLYRSWALKQPWVPTKQAPGAESWLKKTHIWARGDTKHRASEVYSQRQVLLKYVKLFGTPIGVQLYNWANESVYEQGNGSATSSGFTFTSRWPPSPGWDWADLKSKGVHVLPYVNSEADNDGDQNWRVDGGESSAIRDSGGDTIGVGDPGSVAMCASQESWHRRLMNTSLRLLRAGASGVYMDQSGNQAQIPCFAKGHNHTLGGGNYGGQGLVKMFGSVQKAMRAVDPQAMMAGEVPPEELLSTIDLRLLHFNVWPGEIPLMQSIYSGYSTSFGRTIVCHGPEAADAGLKMRVANMLHTGSTFGRLWVDSWGDTSVHDETVYLQQHVGFRRQLSRFFVHGSLLRPVKAHVLAGPATVSLVPAEEIKHNLTLPSFLASLWLSHSEREMGLMLSNLAEQPLELSMAVELQRTWPAAAADTSPPRTLEITKLEYDRIDKPLAGAAVGTMQGGASAAWTVRQKLVVGGAVFLKLEFKKGA
jgi:hypothetical protein